MSELTMEALDKALDFMRESKEAAIAKGTLYSIVCTCPACMECYSEELKERINELET